MQTNRFETFFDAIIAIIITVLVLKIPQPTSPTLDAFLSIVKISIHEVSYGLIKKNTKNKRHS